MGENFKIDAEDGVIPDLGEGFDGSNFAVMAGEVDVMVVVDDDESTPVDATCGSWSVTREDYLKALAVANVSAGEPARKLRRKGLTAHYCTWCAKSCGRRAMRFGYCKTSAQLLGTWTTTSERSKANHQTPGPTIPGGLNH
jgi:hypothetical protein